MRLVRGYLAKFRVKVDELRHIKDGPHRIALGMGIGSYIAVLPPLGFKAILAIGLAKLFRGNIVAAAIGVVLHNILLPIRPLLLFWMYKIGVMILGRPGELGGIDEILEMELSELFQWSVFFSYQVPMLVGGVIMGIPFGLAGYFVTLRMFRLKDDEL